MPWKCLSFGIMFIVCLLGCTRSGPANKSSDAAKKSEEEVKQAFASLQTAIKKKDIDSIWNSLTKDSQSDAEAQAKLVKEAFSKATDKAFFEKRYQLTSEELVGMTGKLYAKSKVFFDHEIHEMPDSQLTKVEVSGDSGKVFYTEEKGGKEDRPVKREDGQWKFELPVAKAVLK